MDKRTNEAEVHLQFTDDLFDEDTGGYSNDLESKLREYDTNVIRVELSETLDSKRLLRPAMLEALLSELPCSVSEFCERIPAYLRNGTDSKEGKYLESVLSLIAQYG